MHNFTLNPEDWVRSEHICGLARPLVQGSIKRHRNSSEKSQIITKPTNIWLHHKNMELYFDFYI